MELLKQLKSGKKGYKEANMSSFLKIALENLIKGPSTEKYPFGETFVPVKLRGKIKHDPNLCIACHICEHVCAGGAIRIEETEDGRGIDFVVWHNTCAFCGLCEHYCPTGAIHLTNDYHTAHLQQEKYSFVERSFIKYQPCSCCGKPMVPIVPKIAEKANGKESGINEPVRMCEDCRRRIIAKRWVIK
jgi:formate hydrogenlyase subunit 6/NADH:ubiquinone oxidoreductase subunit I